MSKPMTNKFTLEEMVMRVVGPIEPIGETHTDKDRLQNLENLSVKLPALYDAMTTTQRRSVRDEYIRRQNGRCYHCNQMLE